MIAIIGLIIGVVLGVVLEPTIAHLAAYLPIAVVAAIDALFGAGRAWLEKVLGPRLHRIVLLECPRRAFLVFLGAQFVGAAMTTATAVLGIRIFTPAIRRAIFGA